MSYTSNLTTEQFNEIQYLLPIKKKTRPRKWSDHEVINGIMYLLVTGCQWRNLPTDMPPWKTVYRYFREWKQAGIVDHILKKYGTKVSPLAGKKSGSNTGYYR
jgi:transposase